MRILREELLELTDAALEWPTPNPPPPPTLRRWTNHGVRGVKLETAKIGWRIFTSREAIGRFLANLNGNTEESECQN